MVITFTYVTFCHQQQHYERTYLFCHQRQYSEHTYDNTLKIMLIRPSQYIHTVLLIYPYGPGKIFVRPCHTDQLDYLIKVFMK
jgi:hypothetical protein